MALDVPASEHGAQDIEVLLEPDLLALQIVTEVPASHVQVVPERALWRAVQRYETAPSLHELGVFPVHDG
jgi:hypothetical protein